MMKASSWPDVEYFYQQLLQQGSNIEPVLELVKHIRSAPFCDRLFACISLNRLILGIYDPIEWQRETLHIEFDGVDNTWMLTYYSRPYDSPSFIRKYPAEEGIDQFERFIAFIKW